MSASGCFREELVLKPPNPSRLKLALDRDFLFTKKTWHVEHCCKCNNKIEPSRIGQRYCRSCHKEWQRLYRPKHSELSEEQRKKANARSYVNVYIRRGLFIKQPCSVCGDVKVEMHHDDYNNPLDVKWFCRKHHMEYHNSLMPIKSKPIKIVKNG